MANETVDSLDAKPVYRTVKTSRLFEQIVQQVEDSILKGQLKPGDQLPAAFQSPLTGTWSHVALSALLL